MAGRIVRNVEKYIVPFFQQATLASGDETIIVCLGSIVKVARRKYRNMQT